MNLIPSGHCPMGEQFLTSSVNVSWALERQLRYLLEAPGRGLSHMFRPGQPLASMTLTSLGSPPAGLPF